MSTHVVAPTRFTLPEITIDRVIRGEVTEIVVVGGCTIGDRQPLGDGTRTITVEVLSSKEVPVDGLTVFDAKRSGYHTTYALIARLREIRPLLLDSDLVTTVVFAAPGMRPTLVPHPTTKHPPIESRVLADGRVDEP